MRPITLVYRFIYSCAMSLLLAPMQLNAQTTRISTEFLITPTKYAWLNGVQCVSKVVAYKDDAFVKYDIFVVR
jgi:hypothetical protein